jgi:cell division protein FtsI (penicillin-binding protein 3)
LKNIRTVIVLLLVLIAALVSLAGRCFYLQHLRNGHYSSISSKQQQKFVRDKPQRGEILDCRGRVLAASNRAQTVFAEPRIVREPERLARELSPILKIGVIDLHKCLTESGNPGYAKIKVHADARECAAVRKFYGMGVESSWQRHYPMGHLAAHVVGFTSADNRGLAGIELQFDSVLRGRPRQNIFFADAFRRPIRLKAQNGNLSDGAAIILTIDATIQQFARAELLKQYENFKAEAAMAIVAEAKTGAILAMVSLPDFEPSKFSTTDPEKHRNRAITDQFEPGSILKPIVMSIALDAGAVSRGEKIFCENGNYHGRGFGRIGEYDYHKYGELSMREILVKSSNIGMAKIGQRLGRDRLYRGLRLFGFGKKTGIELPGEVEGVLRRPAGWTGYSVTRIPFGQEITVSAMQLTRAFCILANGGRSVRPFLVRAMVDNDGNISKLKRPEVANVGFVIKPEVAKWVVTEALVGVVNEKQNGGTGWRANLEKWQVFGKTGTANIAKASERGYSDQHYVASFVAGAPAEDPAVVVLVSVRKPNKKLGKGYTGGAVASPVAAKIIEKTLTYLKVPARTEEL